MVDLLCDITFHCTPIIFVFEKLDEDEFDFVMDKGWESKVCMGAVKYIVIDQW